MSPDPEPGTSLWEVADEALIALSIQQPWAELILQGIKRIELRTIPTRIRGPVYLYTSRRVSTHSAAAVAIERFGLEGRMTLGRIVGTVEITNCRPAKSGDAGLACLDSLPEQSAYSWELQRPQRCREPFEVRYLPFGPWFYPFRRQR